MCRRQYIELFCFKIHDNHKPLLELHNRDEKLQPNVNAFTIFKPYNIFVCKCGCITSITERKNAILGHNL